MLQRAHGPGRLGSVRSSRTWWAFLPRACSRDPPNLHHRVSGKAGHRVGKMLRPHAGSPLLPTAGMNPRKRPPASARLLHPGRCSQQPLHPRSVCRCDLCPSCRWAELEFPRNHGSEGSWGPADVKEIPQPPSLPSPLCGSSMEPQGGELQGCGVSGQSPAGNCPKQKG